MDILTGGPFCRAHSEEVYGVKTERTMLKDLKTGSRFNFMGLFATKSFHIGYRIAPYLCAEDVMDGNFRVKGLDPYLMTCDGQQFSGLRYRSIGAFANSRMRPKVYGEKDGNPYLKLNPEACNAKFELRVIICTAEIKKGEEVYVNYASTNSRSARREFLDYAISDDSKPITVESSYRKRRRPSHLSEEMLTCSR